jgi:hypothetical protein
MPDESEISQLLAAFGPDIINYLDSMNFWDLPEGPYDPVAVISSAPASAKREYLAESKKKNSAVWELVKSLFIPAAIGIGIATIQRDYKPQIARQVAKEAQITRLEPKTVRPSRPTAQDYQNQYIKERGGEWITRATCADSNLLTRFIWKNAGEHERPMAKTILKNEKSLAYLVDNSGVRLRAIDRTEKGRATAYGAKEYARDWGAKSKTRHSAFRPTSRESHKAISGEEVPIDKPYSNGENFCKENSINCLCWDTFGF